jgi:transcriptional regulator with XRE-family HTH domain
MPKRVAPISPELDEFPERLTRAREASGLSMRRLAKAAQASHSKFVLLERGEGVAGLGIDQALKIARALHVSVGWLVAGEQPATGTRRRGPEVVLRETDRSNQPEDVVASTVEPSSLARNR